MHINSTLGSLILCTGLAVYASLAPVVNADGEPSTDQPVVIVDAPPGPVLNGQAPDSCFTNGVDTRPRTGAAPGKYFCQYADGSFGMWESATDWTLLTYTNGPGLDTGFGQIGAASQTQITPAGIADRCNTAAGCNNDTDTSPLAAPTAARTAQVGPQPLYKGQKPIDCAAFQPPLAYTCTYPDGTSVTYQNSLDLTVMEYGNGSSYTVTPAGLAAGYPCTANCPDSSGP